MGPEKQNQNRCSADFNKPGRTSLELKRTSWMTRLCILLNCLSVIAAGFIISLIATSILMSIFAACTMFFIKSMPDSLLTAIMLVLLCISMSMFIFLAWKFGSNKLVFEERISRGQSFLLWETPAFLLFFLLFFISFHTDLDLPVLIGLSLPGIALILSIAFPFPLCRNRFWKNQQCLSA